MPLQSDVTLASLRDGLNEEYVRLLVQRMFEARKDFGEPFVVVCIASDPGSPDYGISAAMDDEGGSTLTGFYRGVTGREMTERQERAAIWSTDAMTLPQVQDEVFAHVRRRAR